MRLSVLDLSPVSEGSTPADAIRNTIDLAKHAEALGFHRYWLAEHHNAASLASSAPEIVMTAVAAATSRIRVGSGGVMLPNHSALHVVEQFRVLSALYPGRIDLGVGRAAGTDSKTALALRGHKELLGPDQFPTQLNELSHWLLHEPDPDVAFGPIKATPSFVSPPELWMLGSGIEGAELAGQRGFAFAYAHHFNPAQTEEAVAAYRRAFTPSKLCTEPRVIVAVSVICGETDEEAKRLASSGALQGIHFGMGIRDRGLPSVETALAAEYTEDDRTLLLSRAASSCVGSPDTVAKRLREVAASAATDELLVTTHIHEHAERLRSYERLARVFA